MGDEKRRARRLWLTPFLRRADELIPQWQTLDEAEPWVVRIVAAV
jgi:hypothetical protein